MKLYHVFLDADNNEWYECHENYQIFVGVFDSEEKAQDAIDAIQARHKALGEEIPIDEWHKYEYRDEGDGCWTLGGDYEITYSPCIEEIELNKYDPEIQ